MHGDSVVAVVDVVLLAVVVVDGAAIWLIDAEVAVAAVLVAVSVVGFVGVLVGVAFAGFGLLLLVNLMPLVVSCFLVCCLRGLFLKLWWCWSFLGRCWLDRGLTFENPFYCVRMWVAHRPV